MKTQSTLFRISLTLLFTLTLIALLLGTPAPSRAQVHARPAARVASEEPPAGENIEFVGHLGGKISSVFVQDNYAYVGVGPELIIMDISDLSNPVIIGRCYLPMKYHIHYNDIFVANNYAYVLSGDKMLIVDVSDPASPIKVGMHNALTVHSDRSVYVSGDYAYIIYYAWRSMQIIDVSDPTNPEEVALYDIWRTHDVSFSGDYLYLASSYGGLRAIDISDPTNPTMAWVFEPSSHVMSVQVNGNYAYIIVTRSHRDHWLRVIDISDPANPVELGTYDIRYSFYPKVYIYGDYAYIVLPSGGGAIDLDMLQIIDVSDPANLVEVGKYDAHGHIHYVSGNQIYITNWQNSLQVLDISDPINPAEMNIYSTPGFSIIRDMYIAGDYAYIANEGFGLWVIDVSHPIYPFIAGNYNSVFNNIRNVHVLGNYAYLSSYSRISEQYWLQVVDISEPTQPIEMGSHPTHRIKDLFVTGNYAYLLTSTSLSIINVSDPNNLVVVGSYHPKDTVNRMHISKNYAYIFSYWRGGGNLWVIDVSNPANPVEVGYYNSPSEIRDVYVSGSYAYISGYSPHGVHVVDISDPTNPTAVSFFSTPSEPWNIYVSGNYAYITTTDHMDNAILQMLDISDPTNLLEVGFHPIIADDIHVADDHIYTTASFHGLTILRTTVSIHGRAVDWEMQPIPNVTIAVSSTLTAQTNEHGFYSFSNLLTNTYTLTPTLAPELASHYYFWPPTQTATVPPPVSLPPFVRIPYIHGRVVQSNGLPFKHVQLTLTGTDTFTTTTGADGGYIFSTQLPPTGTYTLTPSLPGYSFLPSNYILNWPSKQPLVFTVLPAPVSITLTPGVSGTLTFTDTQGLPTHLHFPAGAVDMTTTLRLTPTLAGPMPGYASAAHAFELGAYQAGAPAPALTFTLPISVSIQYSEADVRVISDTTQLALWHGEAGGWLEAAQTCIPPGDSMHDPGSGVHRTPVCAPGRFALFGPTHQAYLPVIFR